MFRLGSRVAQKENLGRRKWYWSRWTTLQASLLICSLTSISYSFGLFSEELKENLGYSQVELDVVSSLGTYGRTSWLARELLSATTPRTMAEQMAVLRCGLTP